MVRSKAHSSPCSMHSASAIQHHHDVRATQRIKAMYVQPRKGATDAFARSLSVPNGSIHRYSAAVQIHESTINTGLRLYPRNPAPT
jgi:hypothetical protein